MIGLTGKLVHIHTLGKEDCIYCYCTVQKRAEIFFIHDK